MPELAPILVTGGSGQIGGAIVRLAAQQNMKVWAPQRSSLDLADPQSIQEAVGASHWHCVINCAAFTAVDKAESEPEMAFRINANAPAVLAEECRRHAVPLIHVSTDYVFDGNKDSAYSENDAVNPLSVYGRSKRAGEEAILSTDLQYAIVRTAWVLSAGGANFLNTMLRLGSERSELGVVTDQVGNPSNADDIASALLKIAANQQGRSGIWHFVNSGFASWYDVAAHIFAAAAERGLTVPLLRPILTLEYPTPAKRPPNSCLSTDKIKRDFGISPRSWQDAIDAVLAERLL